MPSDEALIAALREPRRHRLSIFEAALQEHRHHPTFRAQGWAFNREMGFTCRCDGTEREWRVDIAAIKDMLPDTRAAFMRLHHHRRAGNKAAKRKARRARQKSKALLHRYLTQQQRWDLRATRAFEVTGQDGRTYRITEGSCNNVHLLENGETRYSLCVVSTSEPLPTYDLMLAHKLLLEGDVEKFLRTACVQDAKTKQTYPSGTFIFEDTEPPEEPEWPERTPILRLPNQVLDEPGPWVEQRLREATG